jgi:hypothetical protein
MRFRVRAAEIPRPARSRMRGRVSSRLQSSSSIADALAAGQVPNDVFKGFARGWRSPDDLRPLPAQPERPKKPRLRVKRAPGEQRQPSPTETDRDVELQIRHRAAEARAKLLEVCRTDVNAFCEYVLIDDKTGAQVEQSPFHLEMQDAISKHQQLVVMSHPDSGKTSQAIGYVLFSLGHNPNLRVMILQNAEDSAQKTLATIRRYIESSDELHAVFPHLKRGETWKDDSIVIARTAYSRDPSVVAVGYNSRRIQGARVDLLIADDLLDAQVTGTEAQRRKLSSWVKNTVFTRLTDRAPVLFLTNAWHPRDFAHELVKERGWHLLRRPIRNPDGKIWWHRWSEERLALLKKTLGALEYARSFECDARDDGSRVFRPEHVEYALKRGEGYGFLYGLDIMPDDCLIVTGIDLAAGADEAKKRGAKTVITSVFFHPNQSRQIVRIRAGRWRARQILEELNAVGHVFTRNHWIVVENNGVQRWILDLAVENDMDVGVPVIPFNTGRNKADPRFGVASMAAEFESRKWILPRSCRTEEEQEEVDSLVAQMIDYVPEQHTGDHLMSAWFAREIGRRIFLRFFGDGKKRPGGSTVRAIG